MLRRGGSPQRLLTTVLFTDIVGSTERATQLGDRGWKDLVARHHAIIRRELRRFHGRELDTAGDGFFATFDRPAQAIECATAIIDALRPLKLEIRAGIHMGEAEVMGGKVGGITVHVASRALAQAGPGEILVTSTVREVTAGADVRFTDRGVLAFKGVPGEWRLYAVEWERRAEPSVPAGPSRAGPSVQARLVTAIAIVAILIAIAVTAVAVVFLASPRATPTPAPPVAQPNSAVRIDPATKQVAAVVPAGDSPTGIAIADDTVWVLSLGDQLLTAIPLGGGATPRTIGLQGSPTGIAAGGGSAWITFGFGAAGERAGALLRVSATTLDKDQNIPLPTGADAIAYGAGGVWVANELENSVTKIDPQTRAIASTVSVGEQPVAIVAGDGSVWVAHLVSRTIWRLDPANLAKTKEIAIRDQPTAIALGFGRVWVTSAAGNSLVVIDATSNGIVSTLSLEHGPRGIAAGPDAIWIAGTRNTLVRIDPAALTVAGTVPLPGPVEGVAVSGDAVWVTVQE